jgi:tetratricopeptide (TPR) repeat protein
MRGPRRWGGLARRGAGRAAGTGASDAWRAAGRDPREPAPGSPGGEAGAWQPEEWIDEGELRDEAEGAVGRSRAGGARPAPRRADQRAGPGTGAAAGRRGRGARPSSPARAEEADEDSLRGAVAPNRLERFESRLKDASDAFRRERYEDARRILRPLAQQAPGASSVRELYGLTLYRLGRWAQAQRELEAFRAQTNSTEQHPVLADCYRALGRYAEVEELWEELREASPSAELVAEGRIVAAGALADQGRLDDAITLLSAASKPTKRPMLHHLRMAYALADLYERAGDLPRARELFVRVAASDPDFVDVQARLRALR